MLASMSIFTRFSTAAAAIAVLSVSPLALAGYEDEQNDKHMGVIERSFAKYQEDAAIFDGKALAKGAALADAQEHARLCDDALAYYDRYYGQVTSKGRGTDRAKKLTARYQKLQPWCAALRKAVDAAADAAKQKADAEAKAQAERKATCQALQKDATDAAGGGHWFHEVLDTWSGGVTPTTADHVKEFRGRLEKLAPICDKKEYADSATRCDGLGIIHSSTTNRGYDQGDICAAAGDPQKTLGEVAMRLIEWKQRHSQADAPPTVAWFRDKEGWLPATGVVEYATFFTVPEEDKQQIRAEVDAAFEAAGVTPPEDVSMLWESRAAYREGLKKVVDATASEWKITLDKCKGYTCKLAEKSVKKEQKKAKIKKTYQREWKIVKNALDVPVKRYLDMWVIYQLPGEPYCQVRSTTAYEDYKGGGKYQKTKGVGWGFVRFQKC